MGYTVQVRDVDCTHFDCWNTSQVFKIGHRVGVEISSSAFLKCDRNLNTDTPLVDTTAMVVAEQRIYHDVEHPSVIVLSVILKQPSLYSDVVYSKILATVVQNPLAFSNPGKEAQYMYRPSRPARPRENRRKGSRIGRWIAEILLLEVARRIIRRIVRRI
jgi:hypothetical protein